ncbi:Phage P22-like portal protein [uncultured Caudovirales phage]|uniref:Phage P22-like portal protein n=1 Tax=uncultured Caudovirales phage TaxID=2100421 RepID=A0A6J5S4R5_9CAUD|nr:Phage P22-like portal protein [uncultured Caudovirales phage]
MKQSQSNTEISGTDQKKSKKGYGSKKIKKVEKISKMDDQDLLAKLKKNVDSFYSSFDEFIQISREHMKFLYIDQWDPEIKRSRERLSVPTMEFNHVRPMIDGIIGKQKKNSPQMYVESCAFDDKKEFDYMSALVRSISVASKSDEAYQTCFKNELICGWGFLRASVHYESPQSFDQVIRISSHEDFQLAFFDPNASDKHRSNGDFCGIYQRISRDDFERDYPHVKNPVSTGQSSNLFWQDTDTITVCDIYYKDYFKKTICKMSDGSTIDEKEAKAILKEQDEIAEEVAEDIVNVISAESESTINETELDAFKELFEEQLSVITIVDKRDVMDFTIKHVRFIENEILDRTDWPGVILPIVYVPGNSANIDGRENPISYINDLRDAQKLHNYTMSDMARGLLATTRTKIMGTEMMFRGYEQSWNSPQEMQGALLYNPDPRAPDGKPIPLDPPPFNSALLQMQQLTTDEMGIISGRYEESRGQESNAISSVAIKERINAADHIVNLYSDNLMSGIEQLGRVVLDLIPHVYVGEREITFKNDSGNVEKVTINKPSDTFSMKNQNDLNHDESNMKQEIENDVSKKDFSIYVKASGSFDHQKQQSLEFWINLMQAYPPSAPLLADIIAGESEADGAQIAKARLRTLLPPQILSEEDGTPMPQPQPDPQMEIQKMQMQLLQKDLELKEQKIENDKSKAEADIAMSMQDYQMKKEELDFKQEKAAEEAKISRARLGIDADKLRQR